MHHRQKHFMAVTQASTFDEELEDLVDAK